MRHIQLWKDLWLSFDVTYNSISDIPRNILEEFKDEKIVYKNLKSLKKEEKIDLNYKLRHLGLMICSQQIMEDIINNSLKIIKSELKDNNFVAPKKEKSAPNIGLLHHSYSGDLKESSSGDVEEFIVIPKRVKDNKNALSVPTISIDHHTPLWVPDSLGMNCSLCKRAFNIVVRKHHCRACDYFILIFF